MTSSLAAPENSDVIHSSVAARQVRDASTSGVKSRGCVSFGDKLAELGAKLLDNAVTSLPPKPDTRERDVAPLKA